MENNNKKLLREIECNDLIGKWNNLGGMEVGIVICVFLQFGVSICKGNQCEGYFNIINFVRKFFFSLSCVKYKKVILMYGKVYDLSDICMVFVKKIKFCNLILFYNLVQ